jgi:hypothetical protein
MHPLIFAVLLTALRFLGPTETALQKVTVGVAALLLLVLEFRVLGLRLHELVSEFKHLSAMLRGAQR